MYMQNFVWINKKIKDGGSILSMSKGDQLDHFSSCSVLTSFQSSTYSTKVNPLFIWML
jgi:hypothetical protein